jgi:hypothetical protein
MGKGDHQQTAFFLASEMRKGRIAILFPKYGTKAVQRMLPHDCFFKGYLLFDMLLLNCHY